MKRFGLLGLIASLCFACQKADSNVQAVWGEALGTTYHIEYISPTPSDYTAAFNRIFNAVNASMSTYISSSKISRINRGDTPVVVDSLFAEVLQQSRVIWKKTDGYFDPTIGILVNAWGFGPEQPLAEPDSATVDSLMRLVGLQKVHLRPDLRVEKDDPGVSLDFNAIAKGYTVDLIARYLDGQKVKNYLIEIGGEIRAHGEKSAGQRWTIGIEEPRSDGKRRIMEKRSLENRSMATSGNYRKFRIDALTGRKYVHIINPHTGYSAQGKILSASVLAADCMTADAYATAFMAMGFERTVRFLNQHENLDALLIYDSETAMKVYATKGFRQGLQKE
ncbi:MAG: FAD:protein FMN transferase [Flavobacteriales bacterium]